MDKFNVKRERARSKSLHFEPTLVRTTNTKVGTQHIATDLFLYLILTFLFVLNYDKELRKCKLCDYCKINKKKGHQRKGQEERTNTLETQMNDCLIKLLFDWCDLERPLKNLLWYDLANKSVSLQKLFPFLFEDYLNCVRSVQRTIIKVMPLIDCSKTLEEYVQKELNLSQSINPLNSSTPEGSPHSMNMEIIRISTFRNFPQTTSISTIRLAKEGFYYTGDGNKVACFACGVHRDGWKADDDPREIHCRLSPNCPFLISCQSGNVPVQEKENVASNHTDTQPREENGGSTSGPAPTIATFNSNQGGDEFNVTSSERHERRRPHQRSRTLQEKINVFLRNLDPLGINFERPKYPAYAVVATRVSSFNDWPSSLTQTPRDLALAGFLYAGYGDYTRCFFCGGGLRNWEPGDDPWIEHARWFPKCAFLRQNKGDEFVVLVQIEHNEMEASEAMNTEKAAVGAVSNTCRNNSKLTEAEERNTATSNIFNLVSVQSVLEMGYTRQTVKEAFDLLRVTKHIDDISGEDLIDAILSKEENSTISDIQPASHNPEPKAQGRTYNDAGDTTEINKTEDKPNIDSYSDTKALIEENRRLKDLRVCKICLENEASIAMLPCGHLCCCPDCAPAMRKCPICRQFVKGTVKTWLV
ncbi:putative inhibitor of apoptosis [Saccostrea cucullata]|uniref:putative inhibitor of apoptosis n=1 Tax=Saccostrea cuccullata TaxID=36930 RepID=UPI002ED0AD6F